MSEPELPESQHTDAELVRRYRSGERSALEFLLRRYQDAVYSVALRWLSDPREAAEATRHVFLSLAAQVLQERAAPRIQIFQLLVRECERLRPERSAEKLKGEEGDAARLQAALSELEDAELSALLLRDLADLDPDEIAEVLEISTGSARSRLQRARLRLGRILETRSKV